MLRRLHVARVLGALALVVISCDVSTALPMLPMPQVLPTLSSGGVQTVIAGTAGAAQSQTAVRLPATETTTPTPTLTRTPTLTPTFTPTFLFLLRSPTPSRTATPIGGLPVGDLACELLSQDPADGTHLDPKTDFDAVWKVKNTGSGGWDSNSVDFAYFSGTKMYKNNNKIYDLAKDVGVNGTISLIADMVAPQDSGKYKTVYTLRLGNNDFCHVTLTIRVP
jgi:hypothetical protein